MDNTPTPPAFPIVEIGGQKLIVKFDFLAKYRMSQLGIGPRDLRLLGGGATDPGVVALSLKLFSCAVASNFIDPANPAAPAPIPSPEYWASQIGDDTAKWGEICQATMQAMVKVLPTAGAPPLEGNTTGRAN